MTISAATSSSGTTITTSGVLLLLLTTMCYVHSTPLPPSQVLCPQENIPTNQVETWPGNIIPYKMSDDLTAEARRELKRSMAFWESRSCIAFIPRHEQERQQDHFVYFVPDERCCSNRGSTGTGRQNVYVHDTCITDRTIEDVIGTLIGNTQQTSNDGQSRDNTDVPVPGTDEKHREPSANMSTPWTADCHNMCKKYISMTQNGKLSKHGNIYSPNYPLDYQSNTECVWRVSVPENFVFQMNFLHFDTEYSHDYECSHDFMEIHYLTADGAIRSLPRHCGDLSNSISFTSHLSEDTVLIRFHTDTLYNYAGFNISYKFIENKRQCDVNNGGCSERCETDSSGIGKCVCQPGYKFNRKSEICKDINECGMDNHGCEQNCNNTPGSYQCSCNQGYALGVDQRLCDRCESLINKTEDTITSTGYPGYYHDQQNCNYTILIRPEHILRITLLHVDIPRSPNCKSEFLKLDHGHFMYNRRLCGFLPHISYYIKDANVTSTSFRFRTRTNVHRNTGFEVQFKQVLRSSVSEEAINQVIIGNDAIDYKDRPWIEN